MEKKKHKRKRKRRGRKKKNRENNKKRVRDGVIERRHWENEDIIWVYKDFAIDVGRWSLRKW